MLQADGITYEIETPDGPLKLLDNVSFNVPRGHFMAVVGPSGCGKTTLLKAIAGMIAETGGRFFWNGHDLAEEDFEPSEIGFVPQFSIAYDQLSVDENVESAARLRCRFNSVDDLDDSIDNALEVTGMEGITDRDVKILSGGQKRRLALAMELVSNPRLLICDEVTAGLDPRSEHDIVFLLHEISRSEGRIVISVTHSLSIWTGMIPSWSCTRAAWLTTVPRKPCCITSAFPRWRRFTRSSRIAKALPGAGP